MHWPATGLVLKLPKCALIPYSDLNLQKLKDLIDDGGNFWFDCNVTLAAKYLGFALGPGAAALAWAEPLAKCRRAALCVRAEKLGLTRSVLLFNQKAISTLAFVAQLLSPPQWALRSFKDITQLITAAPRNAIPARILMYLTDIGSSVEIMDLEMVSIAARFRLAHDCARLQQIVDDIEAARHGDGLAVARSPQWYQSYVAHLSLAQVHSSLADLRLRPLLRSTSGSLQKAAMRRLRRSRPREIAAQRLRARVEKLVPGTTDAKICSGISK